MNSSSSCMTDLEVILEFLDEHYRKEALERDKVGDLPMPLPCVLLEEHQALEQVCTYSHMGPVPQLATLATCDQCVGNGESPLLPADSRLWPSGVQETLMTPRGFGEHPHPLGVSAGKALLPRPVGVDLPSTPHASAPGRLDESLLGSSTPARRGRKLRLFHFLFEMLENPGMAHCVSWVPSAASGVFCFSSQNKEHIAELWGRRKGNRRPMTYQKMSRALRNYAQSGEIVKVKRKLTYRFSCATLRVLLSQRTSENATAQHNQPHQP